MEALCSVEGCGRKVKARGLCTGHYERQRRHGSPGDHSLAAAPGEPLAFIRSAVALAAAGHDDCILWPHARTTIDLAYGALSYAGRVRGAHVVALIESGSPQPFERAEVLHACDVGLCVNPGHLSWGASSDNGADMAVKDRGARKVTNTQVREIRQSRESSSVVARRYGISDAQVRNIRRRADRSGRAHVA